MADVEQAVIDRLVEAVGYGPEIGEPDPTLWSQAQSSVVVHAGAEVHPDGAIVYDWSEDSSPSTVHTIARSISSLPENTEIELAIDVKAVNRDWITLQFSGSGSGWSTSRTVYIDLTNGIFKTTAGTITAKSITPLGSSWYRCRLRARLDLTGQTSLILYIAENDNDVSFTGLNQLSLYIANPSLREVKLSPRSELIRFNSEFDNSVVWTPVRASITPNTVAAPDGTTTADTLVEDGSGPTTHYLAGVGPFVTNEFYTLACRAKRANRDWIQLELPALSFGTTRAFFDLLRGVTGNTVGTPKTSIKNLGDDWYLCSITEQAISTTTDSFFVYPALANEAVFLGLNQDSLYLWGAQIWEGTTVPFDYMTESAATALVENINLFRGPVLPAENNEGVIPRNAVFVQATGGPEPINLGRSGAAPQEREFNVQVLIRGEADQYGTTRKRAQSILDTLHDQDPTGYIYMRATTPHPVYLGQVEHRAHMFVVNVRLGILE